jgi:hypothetical protein
MIDVTDLVLEAKEFSENYENVVRTEINDHRTLPAGARSVNLTVEYGKPGHRSNKQVTLLTS